MMKKNIFGLWSVCLVFSLSSYAATGKKASWDIKVKPSEAGEEIWLKPSVFEGLKKAQQKNEFRGPSSQSVSDEYMSDAYKKFRDTFLALKSAEDFKKELSYLKANYDSLPTDLKYIACHLLPLSVFESYIYRMVPVVSQARVTQEFMLGQIRSFVGKMETYYPADNWKVVFDFLSQPFHLNAEDQRFQSTVEVQAFYATRVYPALLDSIKKLSELNLNEAQDLKLRGRIVWDNKLRFGEDKFPDDLDRYRLITETERLASLARMHKKAYTLSLFSAYSWEDYIPLRKKLGEQVGYDVAQSIVGDDIKGMTSRDRVSIIRSNYPNMYKLNSNGSEWMRRSYQHLRLSVTYLDLAWTGLKGNKDSDSPYMMLDPDLANMREREIDMAIANMKELTKVDISKNAPPGSITDVNAASQITSSLSGNNVRVTLAKFFTNPPASLKNMLPTEFEGGEANLTKTFSRTKLKYRNYYQGMATGWSVTEYSKLFADVSKPSDVADSMALASQARGGRLLMFPFGVFVR